jgi:hypothetical protein
MTAQDKRLQNKIKVVKKKMKRIRDNNNLQSDIDIKKRSVSSKQICESKPTKTIWGWIKDRITK